MDTKPLFRSHQRRLQRRVALTPGASDLRVPPRPRSAAGAAGLLWTALMRRSFWRLWRTLHARAPQATVWC